MHGKQGRKARHCMASHLHIGQRARRGRCSGCGSTLPGVTYVHVLLATGGVPPAVQPCRSTSMDISGLPLQCLRASMHSTYIVGVHFSPASSLALWSPRTARRMLFLQKHDDTMQLLCGAAIFSETSLCNIPTCLHGLQAGSRLPAGRHFERLATSNCCQGGQGRSAG